MELPINKIICGDCLEVTKGWLNNCGDLVLTDPPYGINLDTDYTKYPHGKKYDKIIGDDKPFDFMPFHNLETKEQFWFGAENYINLPIAGTWYCWDKYPTDVNDKRLSGAFELIWSKSRHGRKIIKIKAINTNWVTIRESYRHPTQKPINLMIWFIRRFSKPNDLVVDFYCGSGTTCVATKMLGRNYIGIDISEEYCEISRNRLSRIRKGCKLGLLDKLPKKKRKGKN